MKKAFVFALLLVAALPLLAQGGKKPAPPANAIPCGKDITDQEMPVIPEIRANRTTKILNGDLYTVSEQVKMTSFPNGPGSEPVCFPQYVRAYRPDAPKNWNPGPNELIPFPMPGPTLRARVGDLIELTFLNSIDANKFPNADKGGCDSNNIYPKNAGDKYPDCFSGSVFTNMHYHGTHTSPNTTADNVFLNIKPSPRDPKKNNAPIITADAVKANFDQFFRDCEAEYKNVTGPKMWPRRWSDFRPDMQKMLQDWVQKYGVKGWYESNLKLIENGDWPQYYVGAYPYCFKLPEKGVDLPVNTTSGDVRTPHSHGAGIAEVDEAEAPQRPLLMGQAPGTHWYHAHKHGSTTINVSNGMTGAFIIEGQYDDDLNAYYGDGWTQKQPVIVIQQLGGVPPLTIGGGGGPGPDFSVNGRLRPVLKMPGNSVMLWRIANNAGRAGAYFVAPVPNPGTPGTNTLNWRQLAQDGVQFKPSNYAAADNLNRPFLLASGNRADLLVKAPPYVKGGDNTYDVLVYNTVDASDRPPINPNATAIKLLTVEVTDVAGPNMGFIPEDKAPKFPKWLEDVTDAEVTGTKILKFASTPNFASQHTIDNKKFDGELGAVVEMNRAEEWKIVNETYPRSQIGNQISHPFHIHINPFQISEFFDPNAILGNEILNGTGTVSVGAGSTTVTGTGTKFTQDFRINDPIWIGNGTLATTVQSIASDTQMTLLDSPNAAITGATYTRAVPLYTVISEGARPGQCVLNPVDPNSWKPCTPTEPATNRIWWDVFSIPSGNIFTLPPPAGSTAAPTSVKIPGYFKMRSRFVDYSGYFVLHCHILAHEDRGMMTVVEVAPLQTPYSHH